MIQNVFKKCFYFINIPHAENILMFIITNKIIIYCINYVLSMLCIFSYNGFHVLLAFENN